MNGRVIINRNICDNAKECGGIEVCPTGAMYWDSEKEIIGYRASECIDCGLCADNCPVEAILWGKDEDDYLIKKKMVEEETRKLEDVEVERYGASPIEDYIEYAELDDFIKNTDSRYILIELFEDASIACLLHSIRIEEIKDLFDDSVTYTKVFVNDSDNCTICETSTLPTLVVLKNGVLSGKVEGYYDDEKKEEFFAKIDALK